MGYPWLGSYNLSRSYIAITDTIGKPVILIEPYCATGTIKGRKETEPMFVFALALLKPDPRELNALEEMFKSTDLDLPVFEGSCYSAPFTEFKCNNARVTSLFIVLT
jgi:hypothetical protein